MSIHVSMLKMELKGYQTFYVNYLQHYIESTTNQTFQSLLATTCIKNSEIKTKYAFYQESE